MKVKRVLTILGISIAMTMGIAATVSSFHNAEKVSADTLSWYVVGSFGGVNKWSHTTGYAMTEESTNVWVKRDLVFAKNDEFKVCDSTDNQWQGGWSYNNGSTAAEIKSNFTAANDGANIVCKVAGTYDVTFTKNDWHIAVAFSEGHEPTETTEPVVDPVIEYYLRGVVGSKDLNDWAAGEKLTNFNDELNQYELLDVELATTDMFKFAKSVDGVVDGETGWFGYGHLGNDDSRALFVEGDNLVPLAAGTYDFYLKLNGELYVTKDAESDPSEPTVVPTEPTTPDVPEADGYYVVGTESNWKYAGATKMNAPEAGDDLAVLLGYEAKANEEIKVREYKAKAEVKDVWHSVGEHNDIEFGEVTEGGNFKFLVAGTYNLYLNKEGLLYVAVPAVEPSEPTVVPTEPTEPVIEYYLRGVIAGLELNDWEAGQKLVNYNEEAGQYELLDVELATTDMFKFAKSVDGVVDGETGWFGYWQLGNDDSRALFNAEASDGNLVPLAAGTYDFYLKLNGELYVTKDAEEPVEPTYKLYIGEQEVELVKGEGNEYYALGVALNAGDAVSYKAGDEAVEATAKVVNNNNLSADMKVLVNNASADIYVDVEAKTIWVSGLPGDGFHMIVNGNLVTLESADEFEGFLQYVSGSLNLKAGDQIRFIDCTAGERLPEVFDITKINEAGLGAKFEVVDGVLTVKEDVNGARAWLKLKMSADEIYFGEITEAEAQAIAFAEEFLNDIRAVCDANGNTNQKALEEAWAAKVEAYNALSDEAKAELYKGGYSDFNEIKDFGELYVYVLERRASWELANFLVWDINPVNTTNAIPASNSAVLIVAISALAASAAIGFILLKKKKENK